MQQIAAGSSSVVVGPLQSLVERGETLVLQEKLQEVKKKAGNCAKELFDRNQQGHTVLDLAALLGPD